MSEHLLKILLSELSVVRLRCGAKNCGAVVETTLDRLPRVLSDERKCRFCGTEWEPGETREEVSPLLRLAEDVKAVREMGKRVTVEFVLPAKE